MFNLQPPVQAKRDVGSMESILAEIERTTVPYFLRKFALATCKTGSRYVCNPPVMDTDFDVVVLLKKAEDVVYIEDEGYVYTVPEANDGYEANEIETAGLNGHWLKTYRKGEINLICLIDPTRFGRWKLATDIAKRFNMTSRDDRVELFAMIKSHQEYEAYMGCFG